MINDLKSKVSKEELWRRLETDRDVRNWLPWRSQEEEAEDPERSVSYEDIAAFLFQFPNATSSPAVFKLVNAYLDFLGVSLHNTGSPLSLLGNLAGTGWYSQRMGLDIPENCNWERVLTSALDIPSDSFRQNAEVHSFIRRTITQLVQVYR